MNLRADRQEQKNIRGGTQGAKNIELLEKRLFSPRVPPVANKITTIDMSLNPSLAAPGLCLLTEQLRKLQVLKCASSGITSKVLADLVTKLAANCPCLRELDVSENAIDGGYPGGVPVCLYVCPVMSLE
jgi:hypothetical protein